MSLAEAIAGLARVRGMKPADVVEATSTRNPASLYRILSGETEDPRISTLLELCRTLHSDPGELLGLAGLVEPASSEVTTIDVALRQAFREVRELGEDDQWLLLGVLRDVIQERGLKAPARRRRPARPEPAAERSEDPATAGVE
jgi:DNA-binding Xre family transcriptional regulator